MVSGPTGLVLGQTLSMPHQVIQARVSAPMAAHPHLLAYPVLSPPTVGSHVSLFPLSSVQFN